MFPSTVNSALRIIQKEDEREGKLGSQTLDNLQEWFAGTAYGKRWISGQEKSRIIDQNLIDQGGLYGWYLEKQQNPNSLEQKILKNISDLTNIDQRISTPLTYLGISMGATGLSNVKIPKSALTKSYNVGSSLKKNLKNLKTDITNVGQPARLQTLEATISPITDSTANQLRQLKALYKHHEGTSLQHAAGIAKLPSWENRPVYIPPEERIGTQKGEPLMTTTGGKPDGPTWTNRDNKSYSLEGIDDPKASENLTNWSAREASDDASIQGLRATGLSYDEIYTQYPDLTRRYVGTTPLNELIEIAEANNIPFNKVYQYKKEQDINVRNLTLLTNAFNILDNNTLQVNATYALRKAVNEGLIAPSVVNEYNQIINKAKQNKGKFHSIGHLKSLREMWSKRLRGGDRSTNLISEPFINFLAEVEPGLWKELQGNAARQNLQDFPQYTLERLTDWNVDIQEDFIRFAHPELGIIGDLQASGLSRRVSSEFQGIATLQFNHLRSEIIDEVNKMKPHPVYSKKHIIKEFERALTTSIADFYIENAVNLSGKEFSGLKLKTLITAPGGIIPRLETEISNLGAEYKNILTNSDLDNPAALSKFVRLLRRVTN